MAIKKDKKHEIVHMTIWEYMKKYGTPQNFLAERAGISTSALNSILTGKHLPTLKTAGRIEMATEGIVSLYDWELNLTIDENGNVTEDKKK